jgi:hypothetical protein
MLCQLYKYAGADYYFGNRFFDAFYLTSVKFANKDKAYDFIQDIDQGGCFSEKFNNAVLLNLLFKDLTSIIDSMGIEFKALTVSNAEKNVYKVGKQSLFKTCNENDIYVMSKDSVTRDKILSSFKNICSNNK